ncbi:MAG: hypothetical protein ACI4J6_06485 [Oscillospiraceae bacterium]
MKLNKTLAAMREINEKENSSITIYGRKQFEKILNFKAVEKAEWSDNDTFVLFTLTDGSTVSANYSEVE